MANRLGCGSDLQVFVTAKCGSPTVCTLVDVATIEWTRDLDAISAARIEVPMAVGSGGSNPCCRCLGDIEPWCHELHIFRNGVEVWTGPVTKVTYGFEKVLIEAKDMLAWLIVRIVTGLLDYTTEGKKTGGPGPSEITNIGKDIITDAFSQDDPCVLKYLLQTDLTPTSIRPTIFNMTGIKIEAFSGNYYDALNNLSSLGMDFTTLGRRIILQVQDDNIKPAGTLTDQHIIGEIDVSKDGFLASNRVFVRYDQDDQQATCTANQGTGTINTAPCPAEVNATGTYAPGVSCYGPIEIIKDDGNSFDLNTAKQAGQAYIDAGKFVPRTIEFPAGSQLSPDAPFDINELVCGMKVRVALTNLCFDVFQEFRLQSVHYTIDTNGDEKVALSLSNYNSITGRP